MKRRHPEQLLEKPYWDEMTDYYDIPYECLVPRKTANLIVSGRCISADHFAMASVRVIATCMAIGQAAGTAAALCVEGNVMPRELPVAVLQAELRKAGVPLGNDDV